MTVERCDDGPLTVMEKEEGPAIADYDDRFGRLALTIGQTHFRTTVVVRCDGDEGHDGVDDGDDDDIYIMMMCLSVCLSRKMITSSWESPVTT